MHTFCNRLANADIQKRVMVTTVALLLFVFVFINLIFCINSRNVFITYENSNIITQIELIEDALRSSNDYLSGIIKNWAVWDDTYAYAQGTIDLLPEYTVRNGAYYNYGLDFITLLDPNGKVIHEAFISSDEGDHQPMMDLNPVYVKLAPLNMANDLAYSQAGEAGLKHIAKNEFLIIDNRLISICSYPILRTDGSGPRAGFMLFGKIIDVNDITYFKRNPEITLTIQNKEEMRFSKQQIYELETTGMLIEMVGQNDLEAHKVFKGIFPDSELVLSLSRPRYLYNQSGRFIAAALGNIAVCCMTMLFVLFILLRSAIAKPFYVMVDREQAANWEEISPIDRMKWRNRESALVAKAIKDIRRHIREQEDTGENKNEQPCSDASSNMLAGLRNWTNCYHALNRAIQFAQSEHKWVGVFVINLDRFKFINDTLGWTMGNLFLATVANRLNDALGSSCTVNCIEGDTFTVIVDGLSDKEEIYLIEDIIMTLFNQPFTVNEREMCITASMGLSIYPQDGDEAETLCKNAEIAMYRAKELGKDMCCRYDAEMEQAFRRKLKIENNMRAAMKDGFSQFRLYFQPKVVLGTGEIRSCEALIRWITPTGFVQPDEFIPLAEETGLIIPLSQWVLKEVFRCSKLFEAHGIDNRISVNVSAQVLLNRNFIGMIESAAAEYDAPARKLDIEITETTFIEDIRQINEIVSRLHSMDITVSIDDFGTGYSSFSYLNKLRVDRIKIDREFIMSMDKNWENAILINAIVALAKSLHLIVTAEGVENVRQFEYLKKLNCEEIQGYYISKPVPVEEYMRLLVQNEQYFVYPVST